MKNRAVECCIAGMCVLVAIVSVANAILAWKLNTLLDQWHQLRH